MKIKSNFFTWVLFNILRLVPIILFSGIFFIYYFFLSIIQRKKYIENKEKWENIKSISDLVLFATKDYKYKYDLGQGFMDHDSSIYEWILAYGDCDDMALYAKKKIAQLQGYEASRIGLIWKAKNGALALHFDCMFKKDSKYYLFNYGRIISADSEDQLMKNFCTTWSASNLKYCKCNF